MQLLDIPYERQEADWMCGAAALCMVYRSFGLPATQADVWPHVRSEYTDRHRRGARTPALARHAARQGFPSLILRAARPWELLARSFAPDLRAVVLHRRGFDSFGLHASVLRGLDGDGVVLHDPNGRPDRRLPRGDFLALWGPHHSDLTGKGHLLLAVARSPGSGATCACGGAVPESAVCPRCGLPIPLRPAALVGCGCQGHNWEEITCPSCAGCLTTLPRPNINSA